MSKYEYSIDSVDDRGIIVSLSSEQSEPKHISYAIVNQGVVCYRVFLEGTDEIVTLHSEPYEEALKIVENEKKQGLVPLDD